MKVPQQPPRRGWLNGSKVGDSDEQPVNMCQILHASLLTREATWPTITWPSCAAAAHSPARPQRSYSCGDSRAAPGASSSISASPASRRSPSSSNRHWRQNCRLEQRSALLANFKVNFLALRSCFPPAVHLQRIGLCAAILSSLKTALLLTN